MSIRERKIEHYLNDEVAQLGGITYKWTGTTGAPDRIVILATVVWFVEVKTVDGALSPVQQRRHNEMLSRGAKVITVYGYEGVDEFIKELKDAVIKTTTIA